MTPKGKLYIIAAASGTGKTSLAKALADSIPNVKISISHTTRSIRNGEENNKHYFFVDRTAFEELIKKDAFLEHAEVFGYYYGTSRQWVEEQLLAGFDVILDIDWQGAEQIRKKMVCTSIFLLPPSYAELRSRLEKRKRDDAKTIEGRLAGARGEIVHCNEFDYIVINDNFEQALQDLQTIVKAERLSKPYQMQKYADLIDQLVKK